MLKQSIFLGAIITVLTSTPSAHAVGLLLSDNAGYTGLSLDLTAYKNGSYNYTFGPASIPGGITFTSNNNGGNSGRGSVIGQGVYSLGGNGSFDANPVYIGLDSQTGYMTFSFATPQKSFGAYLNYGPGATTNQPTISTYDASNNLLSSYNLATTAPISTPGAVDRFAFRGIDEGSSVISSFRLAGSYLLAAGSANGNVPPVQTPQSVPEPMGAIGTLLGLATVLGLKKWVGIGKHSAITNKLDELEIQVCRQNCKQIIDASSRFFAIDTVNKGSDCETDIYCSDKDAVIGQGLLMQVLDAESGEPVINIDREFADLLAKYPLSSRLLDRHEIDEAAELLDRIC